MKMTQEEFDQQFREALDLASENMASRQEIDVKQFYGMMYFFENLRFFSPILYDLLQKGKVER